VTDRAFSGLLTSLVFFIAAPGFAQQSGVSSEREMRGTARGEADAEVRATGERDGESKASAEVVIDPKAARATDAQAEQLEYDEETYDTESGPPLAVEPPKRLSGIAEVGIGWLLLPNAVVCGAPSAGCSRGDTTPTVDVWNLVRLPIGLAFGAGLSLGLIPTADVPQDNPPGVERDHKRGYMTIEGLFRYYPWQGKSFEGWVGIGPGLVIVSDTYSSRAGVDENAYVGNPGVTLRTEGLSVLAALGANLELTEHWYLGATARGGVWRVPDTPAMSPLGDEASLTGTNIVAYAGINVAFRSKL
jgi:hypothetical protein